MISFKQLSYALAVEKTLHFNKAAALCSVSQSALSSAIMELEKQLDIQIFERDNKKVLITPRGRQVLAKLRDIKIQVDDLHRFARVHQAPLSSTLSLGVIPTIGPYLLPRVLPLVRKRYPDAQLRIVEEQTHALIDRVKNGELDTAILALPYPTEGLHAFEFWQEDFYWITHADDSQAQRNEIASDELNQSRLMLLKDGHCLKDHALAACKMQPSAISETLAATSLYTIVQMVAGRMGTTLAPEMALDQLISGSPELRAVHLNEPGPHRRIAFVARLNYAGVDNIQLLIKLFRQQLLKLSPPPAGSGVRIDP